MNLMNICLVQECPKAMPAHYHVHGLSRSQLIQSIHTGAENVAFTVPTGSTRGFHSVLFVVELFFINVFLVFPQSMQRAPLAPDEFYSFEASCTQLQLLPLFCKICLFMLRFRWAGTWIKQTWLVQECPKAMPAKHDFCPQLVVTLGLLVQSDCRERIHRFGFEASNVITSET